MARESKIEWTKHTWSPWIGCTKVSAGCKFCYAEALMALRYKRVGWGKGAPRSLGADSGWLDVLKWNAEAANANERARVFPSLCDVFDEEVPDEWRARFFVLVGATPWLDWLILTKRPEAMYAYMNPLQGAAIHDEADRMQGTPLHRVAKAYRENLAIRSSFPTWHNVWLGTSVENQETCDERIPWLARTPAAKRFLSVEPLLGGVDLGMFDTLPEPSLHTMVMDAIDWVIVGGESQQNGQQARPFYLNWARSLRDECAEARVPFFLKQLGSSPVENNRALELLDKKGGDWTEWPADLCIREEPRTPQVRCL